MFIFLSKQLETRRYMGRSKAQGTADYSESESSPLLSLSTRAGTPLGHTGNSCCEAFMGCTLRSQIWLAKEGASAVVRIWWLLWVHVGCCKPAVRGLFAGLTDVHQLTCTHFAPPECALWRTKGFWGASGEATARGVNLCADVVC